MKKTSKFSKRSKINAILASLILGSLTLTGCDFDINAKNSGTPNPETPNPEKTDPEQGNQNSENGSIVVNYTRLLEEINKKIKANDNLKDKNIEVKLENGSFVVQNIDKLGYVTKFTPSGDYSSLETTEPFPNDDNGNINLIEAYNLQKNAKTGLVYSDLNETDKADYDTIDNEKLKSPLYEIINDLSFDDLKDAIVGLDEATFNAKKIELKDAVDDYNIPAITIDGEKGIKYVIGENQGIYLKMSDLSSNQLPQATENGAEVIPGVKRISKNGRTALDFTTLQNGNILIDFDGLNQVYDELKSFYRGGFVLDGTTVTLANTKDAKISGVLYPKDFEGKNSKTLSIFDKISELDDDNLPEAQIISLSAGNIYGTGIDKIAKKYYNSSKLKGSISINRNTEYDAKEALVKNGVQEPMFNSDNSYNTDADQIDAGFAALLLSTAGVQIKNVIINGSWPTERDINGTLINSVVMGDMSVYNESIQVEGMLSFKDKMPKILSPQGLTKVIVKSYHPDDCYSDSSMIYYDISGLEDEQENILNNQNNQQFARYFYISADKKTFAKEKFAGEQVYLFSDETYYGSAGPSSKEYTNAELEKLGNDGTTPTGTPITERQKVSSVRANNIKLTPVQKLLLDDQHIYG